MNRSRKFPLFLAAVFSVSLLTTVFASPKEGAKTYRVGDVDLSGGVGATDLTLLARDVGGIEALPDTAMIVAPDKSHHPIGDVDLSGDVGATDLTLLARDVGGIEALNVGGYGILKSDEKDDGGSSTVIVTPDDPI